MKEFLSKNKEQVKQLAIAYILSRLLLIGLLYALNGFDITKLFDCEHYINIAKNGYTQPMEYAFFPLLPLIIRYFGIFGTCIINQIAVIGTTYFIYKIAEEQFHIDPVLACRIWLVSPISMFTILPYTEPLFIFFTIASYYLYKNKKYYILAGIFLGLSVMIRSTGSLLFFTIALFMFINLLKKEEKFLNCVKVFVPATIISLIYPIYLQITLGNWKFFMDVQYTEWGKIHSNLLNTFLKFPFVLTVSHPFVRVVYAIDFIITGIFIILLIIFLAKKIIKKDITNYDIYTYMIISLLVITATCSGEKSPMVSYYRYFYACFPVFFLLPQKKYVLNIHKAVMIIYSLFFYFRFYFF